MSQRAHLIRAIPIRLVDLSWSGCRVASSQPVPLGTTGELRIDVAGTEHRDPIEIVSRTDHPGSGQAVTLGGKFVWGRAPHAASLKSHVPSLCAIP